MNGLALFGAGSVVGASGIREQSSEAGGWIYTVHIRRPPGEGRRAGYPCNFLSSAEYDDEGGSISGSTGVCQSRSANSQVCSLGA